MTSMKRAFISEQLNIVLFYVIYPRVVVVVIANHRQARVYSLNIIHQNVAIFGIKDWQDFISGCIFSWAPSSQNLSLGGGVDRRNLFQTSSLDLWEHKAAVFRVVRFFEDHRIVDSIDNDIVCTHVSCRRGYGGSLTPWPVIRSLGGVLLDYVRWAVWSRSVSSISIISEKLFPPLRHEVRVVTSYTRRNRPVRCFHLLFGGGVYVFFGKSLIVRSMKLAFRSFLFVA